MWDFWGRECGATSLIYECRWVLRVSDVDQANWAFVGAATTMPDWCGVKSKAHRGSGAPLRGHCWAELGGSLGMHGFSSRCREGATVVVVPHTGRTYRGKVDKVAAKRIRCMRPMKYNSAEGGSVVTFSFCGCLGFVGWRHLRGHQSVIGMPSICEGSTG